MMVVFFRQRPPRTGGRNGERRYQMRSHELDYQIYGDDMQFVEVALDPGETVVAEAGGMMYLEPDITFETRLGDGSEPKQGAWGKLKSAGKRAISGESLFLTHFTNGGGSLRKAAFAAPYPGKIVPLNLGQLGGRIIAQKEAFLCAAMGTKLDITFNRKLGTGLFGGEGFILQTVEGDGMAFLHAGGTIIERHLQGETLRLDTGCLVAFEPQIDYSIERAGNLRTMVFGGEGLFVATLSGAGRVWLQSLPFNRIADRVLQNLQPGGSDGEGSLIGGLSNMFGNR